MSCVFCSFLECCSEGRTEGAYQALSKTNRRKGEQTRWQGGCNQGWCGRVTESSFSVCEGQRTTSSRYVVIWGSVVCSLHTWNWVLVAVSQFRDSTSLLHKKHKTFPPQKLGSLNLVWDCGGLISQSVPSKWYIVLCKYRGSFFFETHESPKHWLHWRLKIKLLMAGKRTSFDCWKFWLPSLRFSVGDTWPESQHFGENSCLFLEE